MINTRAMDTTEPNDSDLVAQSLGGSREAFRQIVERYQNLVCSVAYCATGSVSLSQDMAQETFLAAWKDLRGLREPSKLRAWLCTIARNLVYKSHRRAGSDPVANAGTLEDLHEVPAIEALPCQQTITREEEAILWRSLEKVPETYREPLILFYREHQSVENVAMALELSEDAVKQRLSRGRKLLQEEVQAFVENTLLRTAPGREFSGAVLAALPLASGSMATASATLGAKGAATAKSGFLALWLLPLVPFIGILAGFLSQLSIIRAGASGRQRWLKTFMLAGFWILMPGFCIVGENAAFALREHYAWSSATFFVARTGFWWFYTMLVATWMIWMYRWSRSKVTPTTPTGAGPVSAAPALTPLRSVLNTVGIHMAMFLWLIYLAWRCGDSLTAGLVTVLALMLGTWNYFDNRQRTGVALIRATFGYVGFCCGIIVAVINLRMDVWMSNCLSITVAEVHQLYPMWLIPVFSVSLVLWIGLLLVLPVRAKRS